MENSVVSTVKTFIASTSVWHELTPALERVTRYCNLHSNAYTRSILRLGATRGAALTAETAFRLATLGPRDVDDAVISDAVAAAAAFLHLPVTEPLELNMHEVEELRQNLLLYFSPAEDYEFFPPVPGVGVLDATVADVRRGTALHEVKTVTRGWHSSDLRQCLTYAAMLYSVGDRISDVALVNPRTGRVTELSLAQIAVGAGADSAPDLLRGLIYRMTAIEVSA
jgi:hypothetical protein